MASTPERVRILYRRPPDREDTFEQTVLARTPDCVVTFLARSRLAHPAFVAGRPVLEPGAPIVWFAFRDAWYDVGRFHTADGTFRGFYSDVIMPVERIETSAWTMTDLFLDVWLDVDGGVHVLDADELEEAVAKRWIDESLARRAEEEAAAIVERARRGEWPPPIVREWPLERALEVIGRG